LEAGSPSKGTPNKTDIEAFKSIFNASMSGIDISQTILGWATFPSVFKEGWTRDKQKWREASVAARTGWFSTNREAHISLFEVTNSPGCAAKEASRHLFMAQPPRLGKAGNALPFKALL
jgi:hypothetical protein